MEIDTHIGAAMSGLMPDARTLVDHARVSFDATLVCMHSLDHSTMSRSALFPVDVDPTVSPHHYPIHGLAIHTCRWRRRTTASRTTSPSGWRP